MSRIQSYIDRRDENIREIQRSLELLQQIPSKTWKRVSDLETAEQEANKSLANSQDANADDSGPE